MKSIEPIKYSTIQLYFYHRVRIKNSVKLNISTRKYDMYLDVPNSFALYTDVHITRFPVRGLDNTGRLFSKCYEDEVIVGE